MKVQLLLLATLLFGTVASAQTYLWDDFEPGPGAGGTLTQNNAWNIQVVTASASGLNWLHDEFSGNAYAEMTNFNGTSNEVVETWLITPVINLGTAMIPTLNFDNMKRYAGDNLQVHISTNYTGSGAPGTATWTNITSACTMDANTGSWAFVNSGNVDLSTYISGSPTTTYIAFQYIGGSTNGSIYEIDNVLVNEGGIAPAPMVSIYDIQYTALPSGDSPEVGNTLQTGGIVTGVFNSGTNVGYFLQSGSGPWNGIYVNDATNVPTRGDSVIITGTISEFFGNTQIGSITTYTNVSSGNTLPAASGISTANVNLEEYEGVLVATTAATCIDPALGFGEWSINDGSDTCLVDDMMYAYGAAAGNSYDVTGPVYYSYGAAKIEPRDAADVVGTPVSYTIYSIQYTTAPGGQSPYNGANVTVTGTVVAESSGAFNSNDRGYWIQDGSGPWHGIYVWDTVNTVNIGDSVEVSASVNENFNQTILRNVTSLTVISTGNTLPAKAAITTAEVSMEQYEGVLVEVTNATCINPSIGFGQWSVNDGSGDALVDDVMYEYLSPVASSIYRVAGPVYYTYNEYKILPRDMNDVEELLGIDELDINEFIVYPNPSNGTIYFDNATGTTVEVYNSLGQLITTTTENQVDLTPGMYVVQMDEKIARVIVR